MPAAFLRDVAIFVIHGEVMSTEVLAATGVLGVTWGFPKIGTLISYPK